MPGSSEDPLALLEILEVLGACRSLVPYADLCVYLSGRYELQPLLELRSLLYSTACRDPCFPATLFRERLHPPCSNRLSAAADVVSLFNLLTHTRLPPSLIRVDQSQTSHLVSGHGCARCDWLQVGGGTIAPGCKYEGQLDGSISLNSEASHAHTPLHLLAKFSHTLRRKGMQSTRPESLDLPSDCSGKQESSSKLAVTNADPDNFHSCIQKRSVFRGEFHNVLPLIPVENNSQSEQTQEGLREGGEDVYSVPCKNPYAESSAARLHDPPAHDLHLPSHTCDPTSYPHKHETHTNDAPMYSQGPIMQICDQPLHSPVTSTNQAEQTPHHQKPKSLDDLQTSTYFGPTLTERKYQSPAKSHSLDIDSRQTGERSEHEAAGLDKTELRKPGSEKSVLDNSGLSKHRLAKTSFEGSSFDIPGFDPFIVRTVRDTLKRLSGMSLDAWYDWSPDADGMANVGTQTDPPDRRALRSLMLSDKLSIDNPDIGEDDISAIFRFLDDISMCGSMAVLPGEGGVAQEGGGAGLPERRERLGKLRRLFHSLEGPEEGVRWGVGRLLQRVTELEQRLEPISELRDQLALVLTTLNRLEQRGQFVHIHSEQECGQPQPVSGHVVQQQGVPQPNPGPEGADMAAAKRRGLFTSCNSRSHTESSSSEHREWSVSYSKEQHAPLGQTEQQGVMCKKDGHHVQERRSSHFIPETHRAPLRSSMQSPGMRLTERPKVSWSQAELAPLDLQAPESLDFWMDDVYTPASDTLLRRSQSLTRCTRTQTYRIAAVSITATIILILIIVIPICTA